MISTQNDPNTFPLILGQLKKNAKRWVNKIQGVPIKSITLYSYSSHYAEIVSKQHPVKYCIVFDIADEILPDTETADSHIDKIKS